MSVEKCPCCGQPLPAKLEPSTVVQLAKLGGHERLLFERLASSFGLWLPSETLFDACYGHTLDGGPLSQMGMKTSVQRLRRKIKPHGLTIETTFGRGNGERRLVYL